MQSGLLLKGRASLAALVQGVLVTSPQGLSEGSDISLCCTDSVEDRCGICQMGSVCVVKTMTCLTRAV